MLEVVSWDVDGTLYSLPRLRLAVARYALAHPGQWRELVELERWRAAMDRARRAGGRLAPYPGRARVRELERRWYGEALGVVGWRRYVGGYQYTARAGLGRQRSAGDSSKRARMLEVGMETPRWKNAWLRLDAGYTDTPVLTDTGAESYSYRYARLQAFVAF